MIFIILNGQKAYLEAVRGAVSALRSDYPDIEVRVTWEKGDARRFVHEASRNGTERIVSAGGDGTLNEVVNALAEVEASSRPALAIMPLGTANDFATACAIPSDPLEALKLAIHGKTFDVDIVQANNRYFINVATGGFVTKVTSEAPPLLKKLLGKLAYTIMAMFKAMHFRPHRGRIKARGIDIEGYAIAAAVCNGRQAGGGQVLAPNALVDDGLLDVIVILTFPASRAAQLLQELLDPSIDGQYVRRFQSSQVETWPHRRRKSTINLDGEPYKARYYKFKVLPGELRLVLPEGCPCIGSDGTQGAGA